MVDRRSRPFPASAAPLARLLSLALPLLLVAATGCASGGLRPDTATRNMARAMPPSV